MKSHFILTEEQIMIRDAARKFALTEIKPVARKLDCSGEFSWELARKMGELGFYGVLIPEEYNGIDAGYITYVVLLEELAKIDLSQAMTVSLQNSLVGYPLKTYGTQQQKEKYLSTTATGEKLGAYALTEPEAGSDAASILTTAVKDGNNYILNGNKIFVTNGSVADYCIVFTKTNKSSGHKGITAFIVDKDTPGYSVSGVESKMGISASPTASIVLEDCRVSHEQMLGEEGSGFKIALTTLTSGRIGIGAMALGIAEGAFEAALNYSKERKQFGKFISEFQAIQFKLAEMSVDIEAARGLVYKAAFLMDNSLPCIKEAAQAKLYATEMATRVAHTAMQVFGGYGYLKDYPAEKYYREARVTEIYEGTNEIQRIVIARELLKNTGDY